MSTRAEASELTALTSPGEGEEVFEPHVAIDHADPLRAAAVAVYPNSNRGLGRGMWCWQTTNGGRTWNRGSRIPQAQFDSEGVADPLIAYGPDGALIAVAMTYPSALVDARAAIDQTFTRTTSPTIDERMQSSWGSATINVPPWEKICLGRSEDHGATWTSVTVPNSMGADKTSLAVDISSDSPFCGHVYASWTDVANEQVAFMRSTDTGRTAERAIRVGAGTGGSSAQLAAGPDGTVHMLWTTAFWNKKHEYRPGETPIFYIRSVDGGLTFTDPAIIGRHGGLDGMASIDLACGPDGSLLAAWAEAHGDSAERGVQPASSIRWIRSIDGSAWSQPVQLSVAPTQVAQGLPAVTATENAWHVLSYDATETETTVRIYSARLDDLVFTPKRDIATRAVGSQDIYLHTNYQLRWAYDLLNVGDYVGLAGTDSRVAAAVVLPETDDRSSPKTAYATVMAAQ
jgi:hypothetical protein